jgi:hypothetical protein
MAPTPVAVTNTVSLGGHTYEVVPQRIGRIKKRIGRQLSTLADLSGGNILDVGMERAHSIIEVFIPDLMPLHEWLSFSSESAMNDPEAEEAEDLGPTWPEITTAFGVITRVNDFDLVKHLGKVINPELVRAYVSSFLFEQMDSLTAGTDGTTTDSSSTPSTTGASESMTSGTTLPISELNAA